MIDEDEEASDSIRKVNSVQDFRLAEEPIYKTELEDQSTGSTQPECGESFVFRRDDTSVVIWSLVLLVLLLYVGTIFLYRFAFVDFHIGPTGIAPLGEHDLGWAVWNHIVDGLFWFDLIFNFFLAYEDRTGHEVLNMWLIAKRYLSCMFWLNLLACLPEAVLGELLRSIFTTKDDGPVNDLGVTRVYRLQRISRLARLSRLTRLTKLATFKFMIPGWDWFRSLRGVRVTNFVMGLFFTCHLLACGWYLTAALHDLDGDVTVTWVGQYTVTVSGEERSLLKQGPLEQWLVAMYFVLTVFTTVGFGDISANTEAEIFFVVLIMFVGAVVHSIIISEVIQVVTSTDRDREFQQHQLQLLDAFALHVDLEPEFFQSIRADVKKRSRQWKVNQTFDKEEMKALLLSKYMPAKIIGKLPPVLFGGQLCQNMFIRCCSAVHPMPARLPSLMAMHLLPAEFDSGEVVFQLHDQAFNLSLVLQGVFAYVGLPTPEGGLDAMLSISSVDNISPEAPKLGVSQVSTIQTVRASLPMFLSGTASVMTTTPTSSQTSQQGLYPYRLFGPNTYFGDLELRGASLRRATMRCERAGPDGSASTLLLRKHDLVELIQEFPQFGDVWTAAAGRRESLRRMALKRLTQPRSCRHLAAATIQHAFRRRKNRRGSRSAGRTQRRTEAIVAHSMRARPSGAFAATSEQPHAFIKSEVAKMNNHIGDLQAEMVDQRNAMAEVKEALHALMLNS